MTRAYHIHFLKRYKTTGHFYQYQWLCFMEYKGHADSAIGILMLAVDVYR